MEYYGSGSSSIDLSTHTVHIVFSWCRGEHGSVVCVCLSVINIGLGAELFYHSSVMRTLNTYTSAQTQ